MSTKAGFHPLRVHYHKIPMITRLPLFPQSINPPLSKLQNCPYRTVLCQKPILPLYGEFRRNCRNNRSPRLLTIFHLPLLSSFRKMPRQTARAIGFKTLKCRSCTLPRAYNHLKWNAVPRYLAVIVTVLPPERVIKPLSLLLPSLVAHSQ